MGFMDDLKKTAGKLARGVGVARAGGRIEIVRFHDLIFVYYLLQRRFAHKPSVKQKGRPQSPPRFIVYAKVNYESASSTPPLVPNMTMFRTRRCSS